ncbi:glycoside hydrolase family 140 protein [Tundrisphaera sp. TA3]|uniref:glycoside hydrolase family 140 protein n=1 Tax=Tundrisphaera sp. TA3 TaxID=3435775 RepID=UPI003EC02938
MKPTPASCFVLLMITLIPELNGIAAEPAQITAAASRFSQIPYPTRVSDNRRNLLDQTGKPFFYLGDTAWELFHRLDRDEADLYLRDRARKRFTVIQAVVLAEYDGLTVPNPYGHRPLEDNDPTRPVEAYFAHVDHIVDRAEELGLVIGMLPTWGDKWNKKWGLGPEIFTPENAKAFGTFLGRRYKDRPIIWILGGDRPVENEGQARIIRAMAEGLKEGDGGRHLMTYHPNGGRTSAEFFHGDDWLAFNMLQSGHGFDRPNYDRIAADYARTPTKPCLDGEPGYEDHPSGFKASNGYLGDDQARKAAYWATLAGACGHTYGCHDIWQFFAPGRTPITFARTPWKEAIGLPGAGQMQHVRALLESRPILARIPDQSLLASEPGQGPDHVQAARAEDGSYAFIYSPTGRPFTVDLGKLSGPKLSAAWYDPRTGAAQPFGNLAREGRREFHPPSQGKGQDWVLVLDDASRNYPEPGQPRRD